MSRSIGFEHEQQAVDYLKLNGYEIIERNYATKFGEIDIIAICCDVLVFIEVKYRRSDSHGKAYEYVTPRKIAKIRRTAWHFILNDDRQLPENYRIDVVAIDDGEIALYRNAQH